MPKEVSAGPKPIVNSHVSGLKETLSLLFEDF